MKDWNTGSVGFDESMWIEKTEHYQAIEKAKKDAVTYSPSSDFIHKDEINWLLTKERGEAMLVSFFITSAFWLFSALFLYAFFS